MQAEANSPATPESGEKSLYHLPQHGAALLVRVDASRVLASGRKRRNVIFSIPVASSPLFTTPTPSLSLLSLQSVLQNGFHTI
jgi:hypothetical protein